MHVCFSFAHFTSFSSESNSLQVLLKNFLFATHLPKSMCLKPSKTSFWGLFAICQMLKKKKKSFSRGHVLLFSRSCCINHIQLTTLTNTSTNSCMSQYHRGLNLRRHFSPHLTNWRIISVSTNIHFFIVQMIAIHLRSISGYSCDILYIVVASLICFYVMFFLFYGPQV